MQDSVTNNQDRKAIYICIMHMKRYMFQESETNKLE